MLDPQHNNRVVSHFLLLGILAKAVEQGLFSEPGAFVDVFDRRTETKLKLQDSAEALLE